MDDELIKKINELEDDKDNIVIGQNTFYTIVNGMTVVEYTARNNRKVIHELGLIKNSYSGNEVFDYEDKTWDNKNMPILISIENAIYSYYLSYPDIKDKTVINILVRLISNPDSTFSSDLGLLLQNNLKLCLSLNRFSKNEVTGCMKRILKSAKRHHAENGKTGYLDFLQDFFTRR